jgi:hypothetical protein
MSFADLLWGPLVEGTLPVCFNALLCDLRPRFLPKGSVGRGYRAVARNGRILLASDRPLSDLAGQPARVRLQPWHRAILPGDRPEPFGILFCVRDQGDGQAQEVPFAARLVPAPEAGFDLALDVGGGRVLEFRRAVRTATSR